MNRLQLITDYKQNTALRLNFNQLAHQVFGIDFEAWYQMGFWSDRYIPYSFETGGQIVANVSANIMDLIINGEKRRAIQIGTVMTRPDYRGQGLAAELMKTVIDAYEDKVDLIYLFANQNAINFYPRFGFQLIQEKRFTLNVNDEVGGITLSGCRQLDTKNIDDLRLIQKLATERIPVSKTLGVENMEYLTLWYALNVFPNDTFYVVDEETIVITKQDNETLIVYDIISAHSVNFMKLLPKIVRGKTRHVEFKFTPDRIGVSTIVSDLEPMEFFIRTSSSFIKDDFVYPAIAHA